MFLRTLTAIIFSTSILITKHALASPDIFDSPRLEVSDLLIRGGDSNATVSILIVGLPNSSFVFASNQTQSTVITESGLASGAKIIASGKLDKDGSYTMPYTVSQSETGKTYLQISTSKNFFGRKKRNELSNVVTVSSLKEMIEGLNLGGGIKGEKGDKGDKGDRGEQGAQGLQGIQGIQGEKGDRGEQGIKGDTGAQGPMGMQGPAGLQGEQGLQGLQGEKGDKGDKGDSPMLACPAGWIDLGPTCINPVFATSATIEEAINACYLQGARVCEHQDLAFACSNRVQLGIDFPDNTYMHTGSVTVRSASGSTTSNFIGYMIYRRFGTRCFGPSTINPSDGVIGFDLNGTARRYTCCANREF